MKNKKKFIKIIILALLLFLVILLSDVLSDRVGRKNGDEVVITVEQGESFRSVTEKLCDAGVVKYELLFRRYAAGKGADVNLKAGNHNMYKKMGYKSAVRELTREGEGNTVLFTFAEGFEIKQIAKSLSEKFDFSERDFIKAADKRYDAMYLKDLPARDNITEGYLFPDTYEFYRDASAEDVVKKLLSGFENAWTDELEARRIELSMSLDEVVTLASIIEREAGSMAEMGKVSSVFHNRLKIGMALQSCATVQYILPERKDVLSVSDTKIDSPYNTYINQGLPKGPIANPGIAAIKAALYPEDTDYYYFKLNSDGVTVFSKTLSEHNGK